MRIVLASKSPRRKELLEKEGFDVVVDASGFDEGSVVIEDVEELVKTLAQRKCEIVARRHPGSIVIAADTMVWFNGDKIGQQDNPGDAEALLKKLSGTTHEVFTGLYVKNTATGMVRSGTELSYVTLKDIPEELIRLYVASGLYRGKAAAYNIADPEFESFVGHVSGDYSNILGLPVKQAKGMIEEVR